MASKADNTMAALAALGYTSGSLADRQLAFLLAKTGQTKGGRSELQGKWGVRLSEIIPSNLVV